MVTEPVKILWNLMELCVQEPHQSLDKKHTLEKTDHSKPYTFNCDRISHCCYISKFDRKTNLTTDVLHGQLDQYSNNHLNSVISILMKSPDEM